MPKVFIHREIADEVVMAEAMRRLQVAGEILAEKIRSNLRSQIKNPNYSRPPYKTGRYAGKWWTARDAGELLKSVRTVTRNDSIHRNIWIICGNSKAYYSAIYEYATDPKRGKKFYRPALAASRSKMKSVIENG
jgi:hypothetical protein